MGSFQCQSDCKREDFAPGRLVRYAYSKYQASRSAYYLEIVTTRFQQEHIDLGLLKCNTCNYITDKPLEEVRRLTKPDQKGKLKCPCCHNTYSRRLKRH